MPLFAYKQHGSFGLHKRYMIFSVCIFLICAYALFLCLGQTRRNLVNDRTAETLEKLSLVSNGINAEITNAYAGIVSLATQKEIRAIRALRTETLTNGDYMRFNDGLRCLQQHRLARAPICELALVFPRLDMLTITSRRVLLDFKRECDSGLFAIEGYSADEFINEFILAPRLSGNQYKYFCTRSMSITPIGTRDVMICALNAVFNAPGKEAMALLLIDTQDIIAELTPLLASEAGWAIVTDRAGNVLLSLGTAPNAEMSTAFTESVSELDAGRCVNAISTEALGLNFHVYIPDSWVMESTAPITNLIRAMIIIALSLAALLTIGTLVYTVRPLARIARRLRQGDAPLESIAAIENEISRLCANNTALNGRLASWKPVVRAGLLESLYKGGFVSEAELRNAPELMECLPGTYQCGIISWKACHDSAAPAANITETAAGLLANHFDGTYIHSCDAQSVAFLVDAAQFELATLRTVASELGTSTGRLTAIGLGGENFGIDGVHMSYIEAYSVLASISDFAQERVACYLADECAPREYSFPIEAIQRLILSINCGDSAVISAQLEQVYNQNFVNRKYTEEDVARFWRDMRFVFQKCSGEAKIDLPEPGYPAQSNLMAAPRVLESYSELFLSMARVVERNRCMDGSPLFAAIRAYVDEDFANPEMSLKLLGERFGVSAKYVSILFKNNSEVNFAQYIETRRLARAVEYLGNTGMSVNEVLVRVGYVMPNTFYKAFKRRYGKSPTEYREALRSK